MGVRGSDIQIQQKLEFEICKTKQKLLQEEKLHEEALEKISGLEEELNERNKNVEDLKLEIETIKNQKELEIRNEQQQAEFREKKIREENEKKISQIQDQLKKKYDKLQKEMDVLEQEMKILHNKEREMESMICEREREKEVTLSEMNLLRQEVTQLRNQNSKLDADYHDKEKTVNILRTRLAVAEQELKDNGIILTNHQNKLEEASKEKIDMQRNLDFIKNKLEKKESVVINLSEELMKANEIISKQQSKLSICSSQLKINEKLLLEKENIIQEKENNLMKQSEKYIKLQEELGTIQIELSDLKCKYTLVENELKVKCEKLASTTKIFNALKTDFKEHSIELNNSPQKSLLAYRAFLSMPSLLPSDNDRRLNELMIPLQKNFTNEQSDYLKLQMNRYMIEPYILRFIKRYSSTPMSLFSSIEIPLPVLISPCGTDPSWKNVDFYSSKSFKPIIMPKLKHLNIAPGTEYDAFNQQTHYTAAGVVSDSYITHSDYLNQQKYFLNEPLTNNDSGGKIRKVNWQNESDGPQNASLGAFNFDSKLRKNYPIHESKSSVTGKSLLETNNEKPLLKPLFRNSLAISAPSLTSEQNRETERSSRLQRPLITKSQINRPTNNNSRNTAIQKDKYDFAYKLKKTTKYKNECSTTSAQTLSTVRENDEVNACASDVIFHSTKKTTSEPEPSAYFIG